MARRKNITMVKRAKNIAQGHGITKVLVTPRRREQVLLAAVGGVVGTSLLAVIITQQVRTILARRQAIAETAAPEVIEVEEVVTREPVGVTQ